MAVIGFTVKNSWEFVNFQIGLKDAILTLQAHDESDRVRFEERVQTRDRELDSMQRRLESVENQLRGMDRDKNRLGK